MQDEELHVTIKFLRPVPVIFDFHWRGLEVRDLHVSTN